MILTGKAKKDFENYVLNKELGHDSEVLISVYNQETLFINYNNVKETLLNALIIEFFFSKDLHITEVLDSELNLKYILTPISENCFLQEQIISENTFGLNISLCKIESIKKANEIYNEKYSISQ